MAGEIQSIGVSGKTVYAVIRNAAAQIYRTDTHVFEAFTLGNYASYPVALTEQSTTGYYAGTFPATGTAAGSYSVDVRQQGGGSPAVSDVAINSGLLLWGGAAETQLGQPQIVASVTGAVGSVTGAVGSVTGNVGGNVTGSVASVTAPVTAGTVSDKTGYALTAGEHTAMATDTQTGLTAQGYTTTRAGYLDTLSGLVAAVWAAATRTLSAFGFTVGTDVSATVATRLDVAVSSRLATSGYTAPDTGASIAADVLGATAASYNAAGTIGNKINAAGTASDPWSTALPGAYGAGSAGNIVGTRVDAAVSTRLATAGYTAPPTAGAIIAAFQAQGISLNPAANTYDEAMALVRALCLGKRVNTSTTTEDVYAHDGTTRLATITYQTGGAVIVSTASGSSAVRA